MLNQKTIDIIKSNKFCLILCRAVASDEDFESTVFISVEFPTTHPAPINAFPLINAPGRTSVKA